MPSNRNTFETIPREASRSEGGGLPRAVLAGYAEELAEAVDAVREEVASYLRWKFGRWSLR